MINSLKFIHFKKEFKLELGQILPQFNLAYHTYGTLNKKKD